MVEAKEDTQQALLEAHLENMTNAGFCRINHNELIKIINKKEDSDKNN